MSIGILERRMFHRPRGLSIDPRPMNGHGRRPHFRLGVEDLESRALMSVGGSPDFGFGTEGVSSFSASPTTIEAATASAKQADGKVVVVGLMGTGIVNGIASDYHLYAARYNVDGTLDTSFGTNGIFESPALSVVTTPVLPSVATAKAVVIQPDGKIVIAGDVGDVAKVIRIDSTGTLDPTFGASGLDATPGIVSLNAVNILGSSSLDYATSLAILPGGQIAVGGAVDPLLSGGQSPAIEMLNADGSTDTAYGTDGLTVIPLPAGASSFVPIIPTILIGTVPPTSPMGLVTQADGKVVMEYNVVIGSGTGIVATRLTPTGTLDPTFGTGGQSVITPQSILPSATSDTVLAIAIQADGKVVLGGSITFSNASEPRLLALRLGTDGKLDPTFGIGGADIPSGLTPLDSTVGAIAIQGDGKIVLADRNNPDFIRLGTNGLPDNAFGTRGTALFPALANQTLSGSVGLAIESTGRIIGTESGYSEGQLGILGQGAIGDYNDDGVSDPAVYIDTQGIFASKGKAGQSDTIIPIGDVGPAGTTMPAPGAYNLAGISEVAVYLPAQGEFIVRPYGGGANVVTPFGTAGLGNSIPALGDYDGAGLTEYGVYLTGPGAFAYRPADGGPDVMVSFGMPGKWNSIPVPADYFGTGLDDIAVYLPSMGAYAIRNPSTGKDEIIPFGMPGEGNSIPVPGDYDGSGKDEMAVYEPTLGELIYRPANGGPDVIESFGMKGIGNTLPAPGDYDGSGKTEVAAYLPSLGEFAYRPADGGPDVVIAFGTPNQSIPFAAASDTDVLTIAGFTPVTQETPELEFPLTQDDMDGLSGTPTKKTNKHG